MSASPRPRAGPGPAAGTAPLPRPVRARSPIPGSAAPRMRRRQPAAPYRCPCSSTSRRPVHRRSHARRRAAGQLRGLVPRGSGPAAGGTGRGGLHARHPKRRLPEREAVMTRMHRDSKALLLAATLAASGSPAAGTMADRRRPDGDAPDVAVDTPPDDDGAGTDADADADGGTDTDADADADVTDVPPPPPASCTPPISLVTRPTRRTWSAEAHRLHRGCVADRPGGARRIRFDCGSAPVTIPISPSCAWTATPATWCSTAAA